MGTLGWLPLLSLTSAVGLLVIAVAYSLGRFDVPIAGVIFWVGLLVLFVPNAFRSVSASASRNERLGLVVLTGLGIYLVKVLHDPLMFTFFDEFLHVRTAQDILASGRLFTPNTLLFASPFYPGLENATTAVVSMSGASIFEAGTVLLGAARLVFVLGLFLLFETASGSARFAGIATLIYGANPSFVFFSGQFAYETLALPFAILSLYVIARRNRSADPPVASWVLIAILVTATVVTHHVSSFALSVVLVVWSTVHLVSERRRRGQPGPFKPAVFTVAAAIVWLLVVANVTVRYLAPAVEGAVAQILRLAAGESTARQLFVVTGVPPPPLAEVATGYAAVALILLALPIGLWQIWQRQRLDSLTLTLALGSLGYPAALVARLTERGAEISARATTFVFLAVSFVVAAAIVRTTTRPPGSRMAAGLTVALAVLFVGGVVVAVPNWLRLPGPYLVGADPRSIEPQGIAAAQWTLANLGPDNRFMVDRTNRLLLGTIGRQHPVTASGDRVNVRPAFFGTSLGPLEIGVLRAGGVRYVLIDRRLSTSLPLVGVYTERGEASAGRRTFPIEPAALGKFDAVAGVSRIFDSGDIQIYDIRVLTDEGIARR